MKKFIKIAFVIVSLLLLGGWFYWQQYKKGIIKKTIEEALSKKTGNLYYIHYDSSSIDEEHGNATFYNVSLQSDSLQQQLLQFDTASTSTVYNVRIGEVIVSGANIQALLNNTAVNAAAIHIIHPVVYIINSGKNKEKKMNGDDSLAIYEKLLGKYKSIHADKILIENGVLNFATKTGEPHTILKNISIQFNNFSIDNTKDYQNILSYFIKDVVVKVKEIQVNGDKHKTRFTNVEYNAPGKFLKVENFRQLNNQQQVVFDIDNTTVNNIATDSFILNQQLRAAELTSDGGLLTFYLKQYKGARKDTSNDEIEIENNYFDEAILNKVNIGHTKILIYKRAKPGDGPLTITNVKFTATDIQKLYSGTSIRNLIGRSKWVLSADGFSFLSENKLFKINVGAFTLSNASSTLYLKNLSVTPLLTEAAFAKHLRYQHDRYDMDFKNIELTGINSNLLIRDKRLEAETITLEPVLKVFNDRTVTPNPASKIGSYPHQLLQQIDLPISIKTMIVKNGYVAYKERGNISGQTGTVYFKNVNGTISNVTNIKELINKNNMMEVKATASFMGVSDIQTTWRLPLNTKDGAFTIAGTAGSFDARTLTPITEPLGMVAIRKGQINKVTFDITGTDRMAKCSSTLLYDNLKLDILKKDTSENNENKKKGLESFVANLIAKDNNPQNGVTRKSDINQERDITKSFFYLVWKSIFSAAKKTVGGKLME